MLFGNVWAYDLVVLLSFVAAGGLACWWLRALGLSRGAALAGGLVFALAPYRVGQSTGHLLGLISFLLPATLLALERRRFVWAALALAAIPLSGQIHLAMGAVVLALGYAWARVPRRDWWQAGAAALAAAVAAIVVQQTVVEGSIAGGGRSFAQVRHYSAELSDLVTRGVGAGIEELVFVGWLTPLLARGRAVGGPAAARARAAASALAALVPCLLALGSNLPLYEPLWHALPPLRFARVPERLLPVSCLAVAALVAFALDAAARRFQVAQSHKRGLGSALVAARDRAARARPARPGVRRRRRRRGPTPPTRRSTAPGACSSCPSSGPTSTTAPSTSATPGSRRGSARRATRRPRRPRPTGSPGSCGGCRAAAGTVPPELGVRFVVVHRGALPRRADSSRPGCADRAEAALRRAGWRLLARDGVDLELALSVR